MRSRMGFFFALKTALFCSIKLSPLVSMEMIRGPKSLTLLTRVAEELYGAAADNELRGWRHVHEHCCRPWHRVNDHGPHTAKHRSPALHHQIHRLEELR